MVLFVPNNGKRGVFFRVVDYFSEKARLASRKAEIAEIRSKKGDLPTIVDMINHSIAKDNQYYLERDGNSDDFADYVCPEDIDPYKTYIFHGGCIGCIRPQIESITGCYGCQYYLSNWKEEDRFLEKNDFL